MTATAEAVGGDSIAEVEIYNGMTDLGAATLGAGGIWTFTAGGLADGQTYNFVAKATDTVGNAASYALAPVTVATGTPQVIASGSLPALTNQTSDTITVTATAEAEVGDSVKTVEIFNGTTDLGAATLNGGTWSFSASGLVDGQTYNFIAQATDTAGNIGSAMLAPVSVATQAPTVTASETLSGATTQTSDMILVQASAEAFGGDSITGVEIYNGATDLGAATSIAGGSWSFTASGLVDGTYNFIATATDAAGNTASYSLAPVTVAGQPPTVSATESVSGLTNQTSDTITVTATPEVAGGDSIASVEIYNGGTDLGAAAHNIDGTWSFTASGLSDGQTYNFVAKAKDAAGNIGTATLAPVTVDTETPAVAIANAGGQTNIPSLTIGGAVTESVEGNVVGSTVTLYDNGSTTALGTALVGAGGNWSTSIPLAEGLNSIVATDTDLAGNTGSSSAVVYTLDTQTPAIAITSVGGLTNQASQTIGGTVTESLESEVVGTTVTLYDNGAVVGTATVQADGSWSTATPVTSERRRERHRGGGYRSRWQYRFLQPHWLHGGDAGADGERDRDGIGRSQPDLGHDHRDGDRRGGQRRQHQER